MVIDFPLRSEIWQEFPLSQFLFTMVFKDLSNVIKEERGGEGRGGEGRRGELRR